MRITSGRQSGVDRAALDVAIANDIDWGGWCPRGGWAEDFAEPPGVLPMYPRLRETPLADPAQRTEWNVRDSDAVLIIVDAGGLAVSRGTALGRGLAERHGKPTLTVDLGAGDAREAARGWLAAQQRRFGGGFVLSIGGPRESEAPGIYARAKSFLVDLLRTP